MASGEQNVSVDSPLLHHATVEKYSPFILGIGAIFRRRTQSPESCFHSERSSFGWVARLENLGIIANPGRLRDFTRPGVATEIGF